MKRLLPLLALISVAAPLQARTLPPRDECAADAAFAQFRARLLDIVARHDAPGLLALTADDIRFSFGDDGGKQGFSAQWGLDSPDTSGLWPLLAGVLASGCAREAEHFSSPYIFSRFPEELDPFSSGVAGPGARLYRTRTQAETGTTAVDWEILAQVTMENDGWANVHLQDGRTGLLPPGTVLSPIGHRAIFERRDGAWRLAAFVAGD
jgi:hypothetical protein